MAGKGTALQEALEKWKKDQVRNQALQTKLADEKRKGHETSEEVQKSKKAEKGRANPKGGKEPPSPAPSDGVGDLKAHLRTVNVKKAQAIPLSKQLKDCLDTLQRAQEPLTALELQQLTGHECGPDTALADNLARNPKVEVRDARFRFRAAAEVRVRDRSGALQFIQSAKGCLLRDLTAAYPEAEEDVRLLQGEGRVYVLPAAEKDQKAVFPRHEEPPISISEDVFRLWHDIQVPEDPEELAKELKKANIVSAVQRARRECLKPNKKEKKKKRPVAFDRYKRITNEHLPELFLGEAATSID